MYSFSTILILELSVEATEVDVVARATAVWNWSESAAWLVWFGCVLWSLKSRFVSDAYIPWQNCICV